MQNINLMIGVRALSNEIQLDLFNIVNIKLSTPKRKDQHDYMLQLLSIKKQERGLKHYFSQSYDQFMIM